MKQALAALWAGDTPAARREPTVVEVGGGFPCGPADQKLFNELIYRFSGLEAELARVLSLSGITTDEDNSEQIALAMQAQRINYAVSIAGTANAVTGIFPVEPLWLAGTPVRFIAANTNTGAVTFNGKALKYADGSEMVPGELTSGRLICAVYNGSALILENPITYFNRQTALGQMKTSAFTPAEAVANMATVGAEYVSQSLTVTGARYVEATGSCSIKNTNAGHVNVTSYLKIAGTGIAGGFYDGPYAGCVVKDSLAIGHDVELYISGLDPSVTYTLTLRSAKQQAIDTVSVYDARISARFG